MYSHTPSETKLGKMTEILLVTDWKNEFPQIIDLDLLYEKLNGWTAAVLAPKCTVNCEAGLQKPRKI